MDDSSRHPSLGSGDWQTWGEDQVAGEGNVIEVCKAATTSGHLLGPETSRLGGPWVPMTTNISRVQGKEPPNREHICPRSYPGTREVVAGQWMAVERPDGLQRNRRTLDPLPGVL